MAVTPLTRLELVRRLGQWSGHRDPSEITSTTDPDTQHVGNMVAFIDQSWMDIQLLHQMHWLWMRGRSQNVIALTPLVRTLAPTAIGANVRTVVPFIARDLYPLRYLLLTHPTTSTAVRVEYFTYTDWRGYFDRGKRTEQRPTRFTIRPDGTLEFDPTPDLAYLIDCDYVDHPTELTVDGSTPNMPAHFHQLIVWWAMVHLMDFDEKSARYIAANRQFQRMLNRLRIEQLVEDTHDEYLTTAEVYSGYGL